ncbi:Crp/Fnr family transcriptional regulator [Myxococcota bacterium]
MGETGHDILQGLSEDECQRVEMLLTGKTYDKDCVLCREGERGLGLILLTSGVVSVTKRDMGGDERLLTDLDAPAIVGELELLTGDACAATVTTKSTVEASVLPIEIFERMLEQGERAAVKLLRNLGRALGKKLDASNEVFVDLAIWGR